MSNYKPKKVKANVQSALELSLEMVAMLVSFYVPQKIDENPPTKMDFDVVYVKGENCISGDELIGSVLAEKLTGFLATDLTSLYSAVKTMQQELEQWEVEIVYKTKFYV